MSSARNAALVLISFFLLSCQNSPFGGPDPIGKPRIDPSSWKLRVFYHAQKLCELSYDELAALPQTSVSTCLVRRGDTGACGTFEGVRLKDILALCAKDAKADRIVFIAANGYESSMSLGELDDDWTVALKVNGRKLSRDEGFPARIVIPKRYDYKWVRWLEKIVLIRGDHYGFWEFIGKDQSGKVPRHIFKRVEREWKAHHEP